MKIGYSSPAGDKFYIEPSEQDLLYLLRKMSWKREEFLDYSLTEVSKYYKVPWIKISTSKGDISAPYQMIHDYRKDKTLNWGTTIVASDYQFPSQLEHHRSQMIEVFEKKGLLKRGSSQCPRVFSFKIRKAIPHYELQCAFYYDQVGSNLSLDYKLPTSLVVNGKNCSTVREWDLLQSQMPNSDLPSFEKSKLANTIGVTIGVSAKTKNGKKVILKRKRSSKVAVYANMWSNPFGFALALENDYPLNTELKIEDLIRRDYNHEFATELGLEYSDFNPPQPIAFCRDLLRGGKPQFFLEAESRISFENLRDKINDKSGEHSSKLKIIGENDISPRLDEKFSPELKATIILSNMGEGIVAL